MLVSRRSVPSVRLNPVRRLEPRTNACLRSVSLWRKRTFLGERHRERQCSCSAVTHQDDQVESTADPLTVSSSKTSHATLIIPHPTPDIDLNDPDRKFQHGFLMLTSEPGFDLDIPKSNGAILKTYQWSSDDLTDEQSTLIEAFSKTALHRMLFRLCPSSILKATFWTDAIFLPCRIWEDDQSEIAWDVMETHLNERTRECSRSFVRLLLQSWHRPKRPSKQLMETIKEMTSHLPKDYPKMTSKTGWNCVRSFVECCALTIPDQSPIIKLQIDPKEKSRQLSGCPIEITYSDTALLAKQLKSRTDILLSEDMTIFPLPSSWLLSFLTLQATLLHVIRWVNADRLRRVFRINDRISIDSFFTDLQPVQQHNRKIASFGTSVLRFVTIMYRLQFSNDCTINNSKAESVASHEENRDFLLGERLMKIPDVAEILLNWCFMKTNDVRLDVSPLEINWTNSLDAKDVPFEAVDNLEYFNPELTVGRNFKAFIARVYKQLGLAVVWDLCEGIGLVQVKKRSMLVGYLKGWRGHNVQHVQTWEMAHIDRYMSVLTADFEDFCQRFGYEFKGKHRFDWAMHHPSVQTLRSAHYGWMVLIGKVIWQFFLQEYVTSNHPKISQTKINGIFGDTDKLMILFDVAVDLGLHEISVHSVVTIVRFLKKFYKDREAMRNDTATRNYLANMMNQLVGCLAFDTGMDLKTTMDVIRPHFAKRIDKRISIGDRENYFSIEQYIPTILEHKAVPRSSLKPMSYYRTDIRWCKPSGEVCFAVMVLTKYPLTKLSDVVIYQHREHQSIGIKMESTDVVLDIDPEAHQQLMQFQSDYFASIFPPEMVKIPLGEQKKHYLVAPVERTGSDIDWSMIEHVTSGTLPSEIADLLRYLQGKDVDKKGKSEAARKLLTLDDGFRMDEIGKTDKRSVYRSAVGVLLFCTDLNYVIHSNKASGKSGIIVNQLTLLEAVRTWIPLDDKTMKIDPVKFRCLPYTKGYFTCLSSLPYVLELMEQQLLAEDYRGIYDLPPSITMKDIVMALTFNPTMSVQGFSLLESIGHSVLQYLYTVFIITRHASLSVGRQSVMRTQMFGPDIGSKEARKCIMGHGLPQHFLPYKKGQTWYPPGIKPFLLKPMHPDHNSENDDDIQSQEDEKDSEDEEDIEYDNEPSDRVKSGFAQKFTEGIPNKHFKVITALCFLREGPSAACDYLNRIGAVELESYPSEVGTEFKDGPEKYRKLEDEMGYTFRDRRILARVFMHSTAFPKIGSNNESLEFVGDAAADLIVWRYIHENYPEMVVAQAARLKMHLTSNELFSWISASAPLKLPLFLMQNTVKFDEAYRNFDESTMTGFGDFGIRKIASDVFEALLGAVLVDSGYSIDTVTRVMLKLMKTVLDDPYRFGIEPPETTESLSD